MQCYAKLLMLCLMLRPKVLLYIAKKGFCVMLCKKRTHNIFLPLSYPSRQVKKANEVCVCFSVFSITI